MKKLDTDTTKDAKIPDGPINTSRIIDETVPQISTTAIATSLIETSTIKDMVIPSMLNPSKLADDIIRAITDDINKRSGIGTVWRQYNQIRREEMLKAWHIYITDILS